jgi:type IV pili sensor histidine kinase/response regulator
MSMILLGMLLHQACFADDNVTQIHRYMTIENKPKFSQINLLSQLIQVHFTRNIQTVGDAMNYILKFSGYSLIPKAEHNEALKIILNKPLPIVDRELGPVPLNDALTTLVGPAFSLTQNPINRTVNFVVKPEYQKFLNKHQ